MTKTIIHAGPCRFETKVCAEKSGRKKVKITLDSQCPNVKKMFDGYVAENGDEFDAFKICMSRPGQDALHNYVADHYPPHAACPVLVGIIRTMEAESGLCVKENMSVTFLTDEE